MPTPKKGALKCCRLVNAFSCAVQGRCSAVKEHGWCCEGRRCRCESCRSGVAVVKDGTEGLRNSQISVLFRNGDLLGEFNCGVRVRVRVRARVPAPVPVPVRDSPRLEKQRAQHRRNPGALQSSSPLCKNLLAMSLPSNLGSAS